MRKVQIKKQRRIYQRNLKKTMFRNLICHAIICLLIILIALCGVAEKRMKNSEDIVKLQYRIIRNI